MAALGKWIDGLKADGPVGDAARLSLETRLATVTYWLPLASRQLDDDIEKVHQLRVSTRRAIAAVTLYRDWLPRRPARWLSKRLKEIRRAAGDARDLDVLGKRLQDELGERATPLLEIVAQKRADVQPEIENVAERCLSNNRFQEKADRLLDGIRPRGKAAKEQDASFRDWAATQLGQVTDRFFAAMPDGTGDLTALHDFRIAGKQLRYTIELLVAAFGPELRGDHYPIVEKLQQRLGKVNDCTTGGETLRAWSHDITAPDQKKLLGELIDRQQAQLQAALEGYGKWWTPERADTIRRALGTGGTDSRSELT